MENKKYKILIATGIYPPAIGGPAEYAKNLADEFRTQGHSVKVLTYKFEKYLPTGVRHILFFARAIFAVWGKDFVVALDTFSAGMPAIFAAKIAGKKSIIRTGGDFLWEFYVERTGEKVLLRNFYETSIGKLNLKEKIIFGLTKITLKNVSALVFSTKWQKDIWQKPYGISDLKTFIIENYYDLPKVSSKNVERKIIASTRKLKWKNLDVLTSAFGEIKTDVSLITENYKYDEFNDLIKKSLGVTLVSIGDISPNMILDAIRNGKTFVCTKEIGIYDRIKELGIFVDPLNKEDIKKGLEMILDDSIRIGFEKKVAEFNFRHSWKDIAGEFIEVSKKL